MSISPQLGQQKHVELSAGTVSYRETGTGPPVVFVHGLITNGDLWRNVVPGLAPYARCICPDWPLGSHRPAMAPGADLSPLGLAQLIAEFLEALDLDGVTLVGNDTGTALVQIAATRHPERIGRLVLLAGEAFNNYPPHVFKPLALLGIVPGSLRAFTRPARIGALRPLFYSGLSKRLKDPAVLDSFVRPFLDDAGVRRDLAQVFRTMRPRPAQEAARALREFDRPALIAWPPKSALFPRDHAERLYGLLPDARIVDIEDSRGFVSEDQPERVTEVLREFIATS